MHKAFLFKGQENDYIKLLRINKQTLITAWFNLTKGHFESKICTNLKESFKEMDEIIKNVLNDVFLF